MKIYNVRILDATENTSENEAIKMLKAYKNMYAAIYGYKKDGKQPVWLTKPILCRDRNELLRYRAMFNDYKPTDNVTMYVLFRHNVE